MLQHPCTIGCYTTDLGFALTESRKNYNHSQQQLQWCDVHIIGLHSLQLSIHYVT